MSVIYSEFAAEGRQDQINDAIDQFKDKQVTVEELKNEVLGLIKLLALMQAGHRRKLDHIEHDIVNLQRYVNQQDKRMSQQDTVIDKVNADIRALDAEKKNG